MKWSHGCLERCSGLPRTRQAWCHGPDDVRRAIRERGNIHFPRTSLVVLENTHNRGGGKVLPLDNVKAISDIAHSNGLSVHMDGARIFNAQVASGIPASEYAKYADSVMFCLSKGLCAPVGSMVVGSKDFIDRARKNRKMLGGGMRQAGILAAAGIIALTKMVDRLPTVSILKKWKLTWLWWT